MRLGPEGGNHVCYAAEARCRRTRFLTAFAQRGVARGQHVVWLVDDGHEGTLTALADRHVRGSDGATLSGLPAVMPASDVYLHKGCFEVERMLERYNAFVATALTEGYTGLRVLADTSFLGRERAQFERFVVYEHRVNDLLAGDTFAALCLYDTERVPAAWLQAASSAHPLHARPGSPAVSAGGICDIVERAPGWVALSGEVDRSNANALRAVLADIGASDDLLHLDLSALRFIDLGGVRALIQLIRAPAAPHRLLLHDAPRSLRTVLDVLGWEATPGLELAEPGSEA